MSPRAIGELGLYIERSPNHFIIFKALHERQKWVSYSACKDKTKLYCLMEKLPYCKLLNFMEKKQLLGEMLEKTEM